ncbi:unnamed protein product [Lota lota]
MGRAWVWSGRADKGRRRERGKRKRRTVPALRGGRSAVDLMFIHILLAVSAVRGARGQQAFECDLMFHSVSVSLCSLSSQG